MVEDEKISEESNDASGEKRARSTVAFPYMDLNSAVDVAMAIYAKFGGRGHLDSLADALGHAGVNSGTFLAKTSAARTFGLIETERMNVALTPLGHRVVQPHLQAQARVDAFMIVPLYERVFVEFRGKQLPPDLGLESLMKAWGVAPKQVEKARQVFKRSAEQAGMFSASKDRLILPAFVTNTSNPQAQPEAAHEAEANVLAPSSVTTGGTGVDLSKHPAISAFLLTMPADGWTTEELDEWIDHFKGVVKTVYKVKGRKSPTGTDSN